MTDLPPVQPPATPARHKTAKGAPRPTRLQRLLSVFGPYAALLVIWGCLAFLPMSPEGKTEGHGLLLLFAALVEPGKRALSNNDEDHPSA